MRTLGDLVDHFLSRSLANIVHDHIRASRSEEQRVTAYEVITRRPASGTKEACSRFTETASRASNNDSVTVEGELRHGGRIRGGEKYEVHEDGEEGMQL